MVRVPSWHATTCRLSRLSRRDCCARDGVGLYLVGPNRSTNPHGTLNPSGGRGERGPVGRWHSSQGTRLVLTGVARGGRWPRELTGEVRGDGEDGGNDEEGRRSGRGFLDGPLGRSINLSLSLPSSTHSCFHTFSHSSLLRLNAKSHILSNSSGGRVSESRERVDLTAAVSRESSISIISRAKRASRAFLSASSSCWRM